MGTERAFLIGGREPDAPPRNEAATEQQRDAAEYARMTQKEREALAVRDVVTHARMRAAWVAAGSPGPLPPRAA